MKTISHLFFALSVIVAVHGCSPSGIDKVIPKDKAEVYEDLAKLEKQGIITNELNNFLHVFVFDSLPPNEAYLKSGMTYRKLIASGIETYAMLDTALSIRCDSLQLEYQESDTSPVYSLYYLTVKNHMDEDIVSFRTTITFQGPKDPHAILRITRDLEATISARGELRLQPVVANWEDKDSISNESFRKQLPAKALSQEAWRLETIEIVFANGKRIINQIWTEPSISWQEMQREYTLMK